MLNAISLVQDLNSSRRVHFPTTITTTPRVFCGESWASSYGVCGCFLVPWQYRPVRQSFVWWCLLPRMSCFFCRPWKRLYRQERNVSYGARRFLELCLPWNEFIEDRLDFSCEHFFWFRKFVLRLAIMESSKASVFLGISRDKLSAWEIFLDVRNSILNL